MPANDRRDLIRRLKVNPWNVIRLHVAKKGTDAANCETIVIELGACGNNTNILINIWVTEVAQSVKERRVNFIL